MTHMLSAEGTVKLSDRDERARAAVKAFRALQPTLTAYARVLTKRKSVRVEMAASDNGSTDGDRIFYRPPIALGDQTPHNRQVCDKRDETKQLLCPACRRRESVLVVIYHEIAHIAFDSMADLTDEERARAMKAALELVPGRHGEAMRARVAAAPYWRTRRALDLSGLVSEYLPMLVNALEDARVNNEQWKARKGTKVMFEAEANRIFNEGVEYLDKTTGEVAYFDWRDRPQNSQVLVGILTKASGYDYSSWFIQPVVDALNDEKITALCRQMGTVRSSAGVLELAFPILARLKELGFCLEKFDEPEPEPEPEPNEEQPPQPEGESDDEPDTENEGKESESDTEGSSTDAEESPGSSAGDRSDSEESDTEPDSDSDAGQEPGEDHGEGDALGDSPDDAGRGGDDPSDDSEEAPGESGGEGSDEPSEAGGDPAEGDLTDDESDEASEAGGSSGADGSPEGAGEESSTEAESADESDDVDSGADGQEASGSGAESAPEGDPSDDPSREGADGSTGDRVDSAGITGPSSGSDGPDSGTSGDDSDDTLSGDEPLGTAGVPDGGHGLPEEADSDGGEGSGTEGVEESGVDPFDRWDEDREDVIDTGADEGHGGTMIVEDEDKSWDEVPMGDPEDAGLAVAKWSGHDDAPKSIQEQTAEAADSSAIDKAIIQGIYFETPSRNIHGVREHFYGQPIEIGGVSISRGWDASRLERTRLHRKAVGVDGDMTIPESILGGALLAMRAAFSDNKRGKHQMHLKSGKVNANALGKRAPLADERLFKRTVRPGKKDYFVILGLDISGSTIGLNIHLIKRAALAQANLLHRMGIKFAIYAHTGDYHYSESGDYRGNTLDLDIYHVKDADEPWNAATQERLEKLAPASCNLDGHTVEYYRKLCDRRPETDKIILYYSDGKMPAENHDEELEILQREIRECDRRGYTLLGVGVRTDSPARHGLPTVQVDGDDDIIKVVKHLQKALLKK